MNIFVCRLATTVTKAIQKELHCSYAYQIIRGCSLSVLGPLRKQHPLKDCCFTESYLGWLQVD